MRVLLALVQYIAMAIVVIGAASYTVDIRYRVAVDSGQIQPSVGTLFSHPIPTLAAPFLPVTTGKSIGVEGLPVDGSGGSRNCPNTTEDQTAPSNLCFAQNALIYIDKSLLGEDRSAWSSIALDVPVRISMVLFGFAGFLAVATYLWRRLASRPSAHLVAAGCVLVVLGGGLSVIALMGAIDGDRDVTLGEPATYGAIDLGYPEFVQQSKRGNGEDALAYAVRLQSLISRAITENPPPSARFEVSFRAHWPLRVLADISPSFLDYVYWDPYRTVHRGRGLCGPVSSAFVGIARENGLDARMVMLNGHVVATAEVSGGVWHVFDSDLGVHIPHDLKTLEANPELLRASYQRLPFWANLPEHNRAFILGVYATPDDNFIDPTGRESYHYGFQFAGLSQAALEPLLDWVRFVVPLGLLVVGGLLIVIGVFIQRGRDKARTDGMKRDGVRLGAPPV